MSLIWPPPLFSYTGPQLVIAFITILICLGIGYLECITWNHYHDDNTPCDRNNIMNGGILSVYFLFIVLIIVIIVLFIIMCVKYCVKYCIKYCKNQKEPTDIESGLLDNTT